MKELATKKVNVKLTVGIFLVIFNIITTIQGLADESIAEAFNSVPRLFGYYIIGIIGICLIISSVHKKKK